MELKKFDLNKLTILWQASSSNKNLLDMIELELAQRIASNKYFSKEYLFVVSKLKNHPITVIFIPTTESYKNYGSSATIDIILNEEETSELLKNHSSNPPINTYGQVKAKAVVTDNLTQGQIDKLSTLGFNTSDILDILCLS